MESLPVELHTLIAQQITSRNDLATLRRVSEYWRGVTSPVLFESLIIRTQEWSVWGLDSKPYESLGKTVFKCLRLVKDFRIHAVFHREFNSRCPHYDYPGHRHGLGGDGVKVLSNKLLPLLEQLKPGALRSFCWDLGSCIPKDILGVGGILQQDQPNIESLSLNTGASTHKIWATRGDYTLERATLLMLDRFQKLRSFSWTGIRTGPELESLRVLLAANCNILETLNLDFIEWDLVNTPCSRKLMHDDPGVFVSQILPLVPGPSINSFAVLTTLSLSAVCLPIHLETIASAFDFGQLRTLKLHRCKNTYLLLRAIIEAGQSIKLESLDLVMDDFAAEQDLGGSSLTAFLRSFDCLRQLYLLIAPPGEISTEEYFESILYHATNLKRLVYHEKNSLLSASNNPSLDKWLSFTTPDEGCRSPGVMQRFMQQSRLESLGCCDSLSRLRQTLEFNNSRQVLKLLHIRCSHQEFPEFLLRNMTKWTTEGLVEPVDAENYSAQAVASFELFDFVRWAFSSRGLPELRVLAFGDFCYDGRYKDECLLFCRQHIGPTHGFRLASKQYVLSLSGVERPFEFLSACPKEPLYPK